MHSLLLDLTMIALVSTLNWGGGHSSWAHSWGDSLGVCHYHTPCPPENHIAQYTCHIRMLHRSMIEDGWSRSSTASFYCSLVAFPPSVSICFCTDNRISGGGGPVFQRASKFFGKYIQVWCNYSKVVRASLTLVRINYKNYKRSIRT